MYATRAEAILREIIEPLGEHAATHDVEAIASQTLHPFTYEPVLTPEEFWTVVAENAI